MSEDKNQAQVIQLAPGDLTGFEYVSTRWDAKIAQDVLPGELLNPAFWAHQAIQLKPFDEIRARAEDGTWIGYYIVTDCSRTWARVRLDRMVQLATADVSMTEASKASAEDFAKAHKVTWRGPACKFSVVRKSDGAVLHEGDAIKLDAQAWLDRLAAAQLQPEPTAAA